MKNKFMIYAIIVILLTTGLTWKNMLASDSTQNRSGAARGSGWSSFMGGGSWSGGSGGHK